jgi:hypothetical protein
MEPLALADALTEDAPQPAVIGESPSVGQVVITTSSAPAPLEGDAAWGAWLLAQGDAAALLRVPAGAAQGAPLFFWEAWASGLMDAPTLAAWRQDWSLSAIEDQHPLLTWVDGWPVQGRSPAAPLLMTLLEPAPPSLALLIDGEAAWLSRALVMSDDPDAHVEALRAHLHRVAGLVEDSTAAHPAMMDPATLDPTRSGQRRVGMRSADGSVRALLIAGAHGGDGVEVRALRGGCEPVGGAQALWVWLHAWERPAPLASMRDLPTEGEAWRAWERASSPSLLLLTDRLMAWADAESARALQRQVLEAQPGTHRLAAWLQTEQQRWRRSRWMSGGGSSAEVDAAALWRAQDGGLEVVAQGLRGGQAHDDWPLIAAASPFPPRLVVRWQAPPFDGLSPDLAGWHPDDWPSFTELLRHPGLLSPWHPLLLLRTPRQGLDQTVALVMGLDDAARASLRGLHAALYRWPNDLVGASASASVALLFDDPAEAHRWCHRASAWAARAGLHIDLTFLAAPPLGVAVVIGLNMRAGEAFLRSPRAPEDARAALSLTWRPLVAAPTAADDPADDDLSPSADSPGTDDALDLRADTPQAGADPSFTLTVCAAPWGWRAHLGPHPKGCGPIDAADAAPRPPARAPRAPRDPAEAALASDLTPWGISPLPLPAAPALAALRAALTKPLGPASERAQHLRALLSMADALGRLLQPSPDDLDSARALLLDACVGGVVGACGVRVALPALTLPTATSPTLRYPAPTDTASDLFDNAARFLLSADTTDTTDATALTATIDGEALTSPAALAAHLALDTGWHTRPIALEVAAQTPWSALSPWLLIMDDLSDAPPVAIAHNPNGAAAEVTVRLLRQGARARPTHAWTPTASSGLPRCGARLSHALPSAISSPEHHDVTIEDTHEIMTSPDCGVLIRLLPDRLLLSALPAEEGADLIDEEFDALGDLLDWLSLDLPQPWRGCEATLAASPEVTWEQVLDTFAALRFRRAEDGAPLLSPLSIFKSKGKDFRELVGDVAIPVDLLPALALDLTPLSLPFALLDPADSLQCSPSPSP